MGHKREAHCFSLSWPVMLLDVAETFREAVGDIWQRAPSSPQHTARCFGALLHQPSPERKHQGDCGSTMAPIPCSEARECPGAGHSSRK